jgi:Flp pilus assembly protein CpaB
LLGLIILLGIIAVVFLLPQLQGGGDGGGGVAESTRVAEEAIPTSTPVEMAEVVIALQNLPRGFRITEDAVDIRLWPAESVPFNAYSDPADVVGKIARTDIPREAPIIFTTIVEDLSDIATVGSDAAAVMPAGLVAVTLPMDRITGVGYAIREGDYVDVIFSMLYVDVDEDFQSLTPNEQVLVSIDDQGNLVPQQPVDGRLDVGLGGSPVIISPAERQRPRLVTQRTIQSAWVLRVGDFPITGSYIGPTPSPTPLPTPADGQTTSDADRPEAQPTAVPAPDTITLAVSPQDSVVLVWAIEARLPVTFALRSATDISQVPTQPVTLEYIMSTFNITAPNRLPYALEPALRSIRQMIAFQEITLRNDLTGE